MVIKQWVHWEAVYNHSIGLNLEEGYDSETSNNTGGWTMMKISRQSVERHTWICGYAMYYK
jgi:hypothetical protein